MLRSIVVCVMTSALLVGAAGPAHATYYDGGMPSRSFNFKTQGINPAWVGFFDTARSRWNSSGAGTSIGRSSSAAATVTAGNWTFSWYGRYTPSGIRWLNRTFLIEVNATRISADAGSNYDAWVLSTCTHEFGHALSLADNPPTSANNSLMRHDRNRTTVGWPTTYDVNEVKDIYS